MCTAPGQKYEHLEAALQAHNPIMTFVRHTTQGQVWPAL